ncbi:MAG TPA: universal stress protein [Polyangiales bacterium]|jgi:universal stress protein A|nr:universal stress protein [Polyangiales bacterium]
MNTTPLPIAPSPRILLVALAFDETGESALMEGGRLCEASPGSELHVVHVLPESASVNELLAIDVRLSGAPDEIRRRVELMWATHRCSVVAHVHHGRAATDILQTAADLHADLIIVGTHRRAGLERLVVGSVAQQVIQHAPCPVLVAVPRTDANARESNEVEAACPDCLAARASDGARANYWCERHERGYLQPHVYEPSDGRRTSLMPSV